MATTKIREDQETDTFLLKMGRAAYSEAQHQQYYVGKRKGRKANRHKLFQKKSK